MLDVIPPGNKNFRRPKPGKPSPVEIEQRFCRKDQAAVLKRLGPDPAPDVIYGMLALRRDAAAYPKTKNAIKQT